MIHAITAALPGWFNVYEENGKLSVTPIAVWAVGDNSEGEGDVIGLDTTNGIALTDPTTIASYLGIGLPGETAADAATRLKKGPE